MSTVLLKADLDSASKVIDNSDALLLWYSADLLRSMGGHIKPWYHRAILVRERKPGAGDRQEGALHWSLEQGLGSSRAAESR